MLPGPIFPAMWLTPSPSEVVSNADNTVREINCSEVNYQDGVVLWKCLIGKGVCETHQVDLVLLEGFIPKQVANMQG